MDSSKFDRWIDHCAVFLLQMGAFPVFVVDGEPSPLKTQARMERFFRNSGVDPSALLKAVEGEEAPVKQRNQAFTRCVQECVVSGQ